MVYRAVGWGMDRVAYVCVCVCAATPSVSPDCCFVCSGFVLFSQTLRGYVLFVIALTPLRRQFQNTPKALSLTKTPPMSRERSTPTLPVGTSLARIIIEAAADEPFQSSPFLMRVSRLIVARYRYKRASSLENTITLSFCDPAASFRVPGHARQVAPQRCIERSGSVPRF
jgi:hypothetical protein